MFLLPSFAFFWNEIYHTLESTMIFTNPSITSLLILLTQSLYFSHYLFQFFLTFLAVFFSPHFLAVFTRTSFSISSVSFYLPHHSDFRTHIGKENDSTNESEYYFSSKSLFLHEIWSRRIKHLYNQIFLFSFYTHGIHNTLRKENGGRKC